MQKNIDFRQGETWSLEFEWQDDDGNPVDLSNATAKMQLRPSAKSSTVIAELSTENGRISMNESGLIVLSVSAIGTQIMLVGKGVYDLAITLNDGVVKKLLWGSFEVIAGVTR